MYNVAFVVFKSHPTLTVFSLSLVLTGASGDDRQLARNTYAQHGASGGVRAAMRFCPDAHRRSRNTVTEISVAIPSFSTPRAKRLCTRGLCHSCHLFVRISAT
ncbi:hypothetical protein PLICRDRAFT_493743 [Plicaturopsis crispa FD-325 SS-3]|uniref:Secreted protein n=1 Tax=Plicaturopsis crispa FD-325 SS-3 TaxID=944288 RepID=A0A0C9SK40_PLICR|nr:hypothetical protein PLICRDRAFT_493743 [Plicaturopsis crispa FD-325 SS-3]